MPGVKAAFKLSGRSYLRKFVRVVCAVSVVRVLRVAMGAHNIEGPVEGDYGVCMT